MFGKRLLLGTALGLWLGFSSAANAIVIGTFDNAAATAETNLQGIIAGQGHSAVGLANLNAASLAGLDALWVLNSSNGAQTAALVGNADVASFISNGGMLIYHDREVGNAETALPGGGGFNIIRDFSDDTNIQVVNNTTLVTNGPGGIVDNTTLDGGNSSSHGFAVAGSLPGAALQILSRTLVNEIVDFTYQFGGGDVYYSTMPLDWYLAGNGPAGVQQNFVNIYTPNLIAFVAQQVGGEVPEPGTLALIGLALAGLSLRRRKAA